jgi:Right handed beta helix region
MNQWFRLKRIIITSGVLIGSALLVSCNNSGGGGHGSSAPVVKPLYSMGGSGWNEYLKNDGANFFSASGAACDGTETGGYSKCLHAGEMRAVSIPGVGSCAGLTASDALDAFNWVCDGTVNPVRMVSTGLKRGKYLSDLIDFDLAAWRSNSVTVGDGMGNILTTADTAWWDNPIMEDNDGGSLSASGTIYIVNADANAEYTLEADKAGLVIRPGITLHGPGSNASAISANSKNFLWAEGAIDGTGDADGIVFRESRFSVIRGVRAQNALYRNVNLSSGSNPSTSNKATDIVSADTSYGLYIGGEFNTVSDAVSFNNSAGVYMSSSSVNNVLSNITLTNNFYRSIIAVTDRNNVFLNTTAANNNLNGIELEGAHSTVSNAAAVNNTQSGLLLDNTSLIQVADLSSSNNQYGVRLSNADSNYFTGRLKVGSNSTTNCQVSGVATAPGLIQSTCTDAGTNGSNVYTGQASDAVLRVNIDATGSFVGKAGSDSVNQSESGGTAAFDTLTDWTGFENLFRGWGKDGMVFPDATNRGGCVSAETCRIWDWSLANGDTGDGGNPVLQNGLTIPTGDEALTHAWEAADSSACAEIPGAVWDSGSSACLTTFLRKAVEILGDGIGNENSLCESDETCLYTPNFGSYQGHGGLVSAGAFTNGTLVGITLLKYDTNGY